MNLKDKSTDELEDIIRQNVNPHIGPSLHNQALTELDIRHRKNIENSVAQNRNGVFFEVGGDMTNHGVILTGKDSTVGIAVAGNYSSNKNTKIIQSDEREISVPWYTKWWMKYIVWPLVVGIVVLFLSLVAESIKANKTSSTETNTAVNTGVNTGIIAGKVEVDTPATFTASTSITSLGSGNYLAIVKMEANKATHLPNNLCVNVETNVQVTPYERVSISNDDKSVGVISVDGNNECIENPSAHVTARFELKGKPGFFKVATVSPD